MRALTLAILLTSIGQFPASALAADQCEQLFAAGPVLPDSFVAIASELSQLNQQIPIIEDSALREVLITERQRVYHEFLREKGPVHTEQLKGLVRKLQREGLDSNPLPTLQSQQREILKPRFNQLQNLKSFGEVGPFLNAYKFLGRTQKPESPPAIFDLRTNSTTYISKAKALQGARPIGLSANSNLVYLLKDDRILTLNRKTDQVTAKRYLEDSDWSLQSVFQTGDRSTLFLNIFRWGEYQLHFMRFDKSGKLEKLAPFSDGAKGQFLLQSPDGQWVFNPATVKDLSVYHVPNDLVVPMKLPSPILTHPVKGTFSSDSKKLWVIENRIRGYMAPRMLRTWDLDQKNFVHSVQISGDVPMFVDLMATRPGTEEILLAASNPSDIGGIRSLHLVNASTGHSTPFAFLHSESERIEAHFLNADRTKMFVVSVDSVPFNPGLNERKLYEIELASLGVFMNPLPEDFIRYQWTETSPNGDYLLIQQQSDGAIKSLH